MSGAQLDPSAVSRIEISTKLQNLASAMADSVQARANDWVLVWYDTPRNELVEKVIDVLKDRGAVVWTFERDLDRDAVLCAMRSPEEIRASFAGEKGLIDASDKMIIIRGPRDPEVIGELPREKLAAYDKGYDDAHGRRDKDGFPWVLFAYPTEYDARHEGMKHREFVQIMLDACDQDWEKIREAQDVLIEKLDKAQTLRLVVNPDDPNPRYRTDITMSIEGMTWGNCVTEVNMPGSEVFTAPVRNSVNGHLYAPGVYEYDGRKVRDIFLTFKDGKIIEAHAEEGEEALNEILDRDEDSRYIGEIALGTNPGLSRRFLNTLLAEKVGGSFHITPGACYQWTEYAGKKVNVNNGNTRTSVHWDITVLMHPGNGGGVVYADDELLQKDGCFIDPRLAELNPKALSNP